MYGLILDGVGRPATQWLGDQFIFSEEYWRAIVKYDSIISDAQFYLPLQETAGTVANDISGKGRNGTAINGLLFDSSSVLGPTAWLPKALRIDNASNHVEVDDHIDLRGGSRMTICGWANRHQESSSQIIALLSKAGSNSNRDWSLQWANPSRTPPINASFFAEINNSGIINEQEFNDAGWHFLAASYDNTNGDCKLYINGNLISTVNNPGNSSSTNTKIAIGGLKYGVANNHQRGLELAGVGMWNSILTDQQIQLLYLGPNYPVGDFAGRLNTPGAVAGSVHPNGGSELGLVNSI